MSGTISIHRLFKYTSLKDRIMLAIGIIASAIAGILIPSISLIMGSIANSFGSANFDTS